MNLNKYWLFPTLILNNLIEIRLAYFLIEPGTFNLLIIIFLINFGSFPTLLIIVIYPDNFIIIVPYGIDLPKFQFGDSIHHLYSSVFLADHIIV